MASIALAAVELSGLLVELALAGLDVVLPVLELGVLVADELLVFALELHELLLCLENFLLLDILGLSVRLLDDGVGVSLGYQTDYRYINRNSDGRTGNCS